MCSQLEVERRSGLALANAIPVRCPPFLPASADLRPPDLPATGTSGARPRAGCRWTRSAAIQEEIAGTNYTTLRRIYDEVTVDDIREAWAEARLVANAD